MESSPQEGKHICSVLAGLRHRALTPANNTWQEKGVHGAQRNNPLPGLEQPVCENTWYPMIICSLETKTQLQFLPLVSNQDLGFRWLLPLPVASHNICTFLWMKTYQSVRCWTDGATKLKGGLQKVLKEENCNVVFLEETHLSRLHHKLKQKVLSSSIFHLCRQRQNDLWRISGGY